MGKQMARYYVNANAQATGEHEVHQAYVCPTPAEPQNQVDLGDFASCHAAVAEAERRFPYWIIDGCANCSSACHSG